MMKDNGEKYDNDEYYGKKYDDDTYRGNAWNNNKVLNNNAHNNDFMWGKLLCFYPIQKITDTMVMIGVTSTINSREINFDVNGRTNESWWYIMVLRKYGCLYREHTYALGN